MKSPPAKSADGCAAALAVRSAKRVAALATLGMIVATAPPAQAQGRFRIAPQPLAQALVTLARQSGRNILFAPDGVAGLVSAPVDAADFDTALRQMVVRLPVRLVRQHSGVAVARRTSAPARLPPPRRPRRVPPGATPSPPPPVVSNDTILVVADRAAADAVAAPAGERPPAADVLRGDRPPASDRNLAEALARMPGVLTLSTNLQGDLGGNDRAARAEGQYAAVRGLPGAYSVATIDGVPLPQSMPYGRDAALGMLPAYGFATVTLVKTPGPERPGDATGAVIDVRSPSAFDRGLQGLTLVAAHGVDTRARDVGQDAAYDQFGVRLARRMAADERLGFALAAQFGRRRFANSQQTYERGSVEFRVVDADGRSPAGLDPAQNLMLASVNPQFTRGWTQSASAMASLDYRASPVVSLFGRVTYAASWTEQDIYQLGFQSSGRAGDIARTPFGTAGLATLASRAGAIHYWFQTNPERSNFVLGQFGGAAEWGATALHARLHYARGVTSRPNHIEVSFWNAAATRLSEGVQLALRDGYPVPRLSDASRTLAGDVLAFPVRLEGEARDQRSDDDRVGIDAGLARRFADGVLRRFEVGLALSHSRRTGAQTDREYTGLFAPGTRLGDTGLVDAVVPAILPGIYDFALPLIARDRMAARIAAAPPPPLSDDAANAERFHVTEQIAAAYALAQFEAGAVTLTSGVRLEQTAIDARYWLSARNLAVRPGGGTATPPPGWNLSHSGFTALLPSLALRWQADGETTLRGAVWTSQTRPAASQLAGSATVETQATGAAVLVRGNPALHAVDAVNLDLSVEWQRRGRGRLGLALFAKRLRHYLYDAGSAYANAVPAAGGDGSGLAVIQPHNGGTARLFGLELSGEYALGAGWWLGGQATLLDGRVRLRNPALDAVERLQYAPDYNVAVEIGYRRAGWTASAIGRWTGAFVQEYGLHGVSDSGYSRLDASALDIWVRPSRQLDVNLARSLGSELTLRLFARNLLGDLAYRSTMGRHADTVPQTIATGRLVGLRIDWSLP